MRTGRGTEKNEEEAERWYQAAADQRHAAGQRLMGRIRMAAGDRIGAVTWLQKAAQGGDAEGQYLLAVCYQKGVGTEKNPALAKSWLQTAATNGHAAAKTSLAALEGGGTGEGLSDLARRRNRKAQYELGRQWMEKGREKEGLALLQESAQGGYAEAAMWLGRHYAGKDPQQSFYWWHRAADTGSPEAQWQMVDLCRRGTGTRPSDTDAFRWAQKAAEGGNLQAIRLVAHCFEKGIGCRQDYAEARRWYARAGDQGDVNRMTRLITGRNVGSSHSTTEKRGIYHYRDQYGRRHTVTVSK